MNKSQNTSLRSDRKGERGNSRLKFLIVFSVVAMIAFAGYSYVPVRFQSGQYKDFMQDTVNKGAALAKSSEWTKEQLLKNGAEYGVPPNAEIAIEQHEGVLQANVKFKRAIELIVYTHEYEFNETVKSSSLWSIK